MGSAEGRQAVLILGGGPAGLVTALRVVKRGGSAVVVECGRYDGIRIGEHLPPEGVAVARDAGLSGLGDDAHVRCAGVNAWWGGDAPNYRDYLFHPIGHGLNLSRPHFDACVAEQCRSAGVQLLTGARLMTLASSTHGWRAGVQCGDEVRTYEPRIVVDATGRSASLARRREASIDARESQVGLIAFRASNPAVDPAGGRLVIESAEHGWWYFAPLSGGRCVCVCMTDADLLPATKGAALASWEAWIQRTVHVRACVEAYPTLTGFIVRSARSQRLDRMSGPGWVAVGDAAIAFDPLSSRGIAKGIEHGWQAADAVLACLDGDVGALERLSDRRATEVTEYERLRVAYYSIERRWPDARFWRRRHTAEG